MLLAVRAGAEVLSPAGSHEQGLALTGGVRGEIRTQDCNMAPAWRMSIIFDSFD